MGSTYETDGIEKRDELGLAVRAAVLVKSAANLVGCRSWLVARLALKELLQHVDELAKTIEAGSRGRGDSVVRKTKEGRPWNEKHTR